MVQGPTIKGKKEKMGLICPSALWSAPLPLARCPYDSDIYVCLKWGAFLRLSQIKLLPLYWFKTYVQNFIPKRSKDVLNQF